MTKLKDAKAKDPKQALADLAKLAAKNYNMPVPEVARVFMKYNVVEKGKKGMDAALDELGRLRAKVTMEMLTKAGLL
jgi:hypothetical protein